ncbi:MAG: Nif3-like dinuclear metal center hexameric protein [Candidatus Bipolaricaulis sp.]|nr:Nif3-like dinuclear metal center hexameric protein [Candidatus Bipolaricaulis sp.]MDD5219142.1 Nif3-like dinuclear metal center hexameric protein [Candidatus Bipolaricaulis sp.]MDD5645726.1 Nif3-like dinuclear metal center hexameric protein [Candidatus Bipolaricaulis sp.]
MNTEQLMGIALDLAGLREVPGDSAIYQEGNGIRRVLIGIDARSAELTLAKMLGYDAVIAHHPIGGSATLNFHTVLGRHVDQMTTAGVPEELARSILAEVAESRRVLYSMSNYDHDPSVARLLKMPYLNIHTPLDEVGRRRMAAVADEVGAEATVGDLIAAFYDTFAEFRHAATRIEALVGAADRRVGRIVVSHGAGTNGGYPVAKAYFDHGVDTLVYIHCRPDDARRLEREAGAAKTLVVTGHIASDSIGINPYVARLRDEGLDVTPLSGILSP